MVYKHQTWVRWAKGQTLVGVNEDDTDFATVDKTGGEKTHKLTTAEMPKHTHKVNYQNVSRGSGSTATRIPTDSALSGSATSGSSGSGAAHNNLQPYVTVFYWKRTA